MKRIDEIRDLVAHHLYSADYNKLKDEDKETVKAVIKTKGLR